VLDSAFLQAMEAAAAEWDVPAIAVGASVAGRDETAAVGCAADATFRIASITKSFTSLLAVELLDLEATTGVWPPDVRVRHLLSHLSGFDGELGDLARFGEGDDALAAAVAEFPAVRRWVAIDQCWSYCNAGYSLAGWLCAQAVEATYEDALRARVLVPGGLESTSFEPPELYGTGPRATDGTYPRARRPAGGLTSNATDILRFGRRILATPRLRVVHGKPVAGVYGLGLAGQRVGGVDVWGHTGSAGGYQTSLLTVPERDAVFVGLTNGSFGAKALYELENAFFREVIGAERRVPPTVTLPRPALESFTGTYANSDGWYEVEARAARLAVTFDDGVFEARPIAERTFEIVGGTRIRERFDFPLEGFGRFGSRLAERVA
jgi:CubicO group peptidase (beta-lactamase class C family)